MSKDIERLPNTDRIHTLTGALDAGLIDTAQGRHRQAQVPVPEPQARVAPPEWDTWVKTKEAHAWYLSTEKRLDNKQIGIELGITTNAAKQAVHKANRALEKFRAAPDWLGWPLLMDGLGAQYDTREPTEEESLEGYEGMSFTQISASVDGDDDEREFFEEEAEPEDFYRGN